MEWTPTVLRGIAQEPYACAWNPTSDVLALGASRGVAELWNLNENSGRYRPRSILLSNYTNYVPLRHSDVSAVEWSRDGRFLATASCNKIARLWTVDGQCLQTFHRHARPVYKAKWNKTGDCIVTCSDDKTAIVWDLLSGKYKQRFKFHSESVLDVDWQSDDTFASCSADKSICVCKVGQSCPTLTYFGHDGEINAIQWDPLGELLASCSDDCTIKIWNMSRSSCLLDIEDAHDTGVFTITWSPTRDFILASGSFDGTVKLWDVNCGNGTCVLALNKHKRLIYGLAFNPDGKYLATCSKDGLVCMWSVDTGTLLKSYQRVNGMSYVSWNHTGGRLAATCFDGSICIWDIRK